jgi:hypothetical protein
MVKKHNKPFTTDLLVQSSDRFDFPFPIGRLNSSSTNAYSFEAILYPTAFYSTSALHIFYKQCNLFTILNKQLMMMKQVLKYVMMLTLMLCSQWALGQGVTTGAISGVITDAKGETLPGANVVAVHNPTGTRYATATRADGRYNLPNVRVGGPYTITASFVGYTDQVRENVDVALGQEFTADFTLQDSNVQLSEVQVTATRNAVISADRTGAATNVRREQFERLPTITRSIQDFSALDPRAGRDFTFGGRSNQYSNFTIDGATSNNVFGLSPLPGGQSNAQPVSVDAIQEISVALAPYDVRQGAFTGAGVNAVTRSGTNEFSGSAYGFYRNQSMVGKKIEGVEQPVQNFNYYNTGFRLGGPIIKNRLFFFVNAEIEKRADPAVVFPADAPGNQQTSAELNKLRNFLTTTQPGKTWTFDPGTFDNFDAVSAANKFLAKIDWNISDVHRLSVRYNQLNSYRDVAPSNSGGFGSAPPGGRQNSNNALPFSNTWYRINNNSQAVIAELNSTFGNRYSNTLQIGYTGFRDFREAAGGIPSPNFPTVDILNPANGQTLTTFGAEPFTPNNRLDQDIFQFNDNFTFYLKNHIVTVGTANEYFRFYNVFTPQIKGVYQFNSVDDFIGNVTNPVSTGGNNNFASQYLLQYSAIPGDPAPGAKWSAMQLGLYAQDEYTAIKNLKLTLGIRVDAPVFLTTLPNNVVSDALSFNGEKIEVGKLPKTTPLFSPRVGFNWDVLGDKTLQLRGGTGIFTGRIPFVWISNQVGNNGLFFGTIQTTSQQQTAALNSQGVTGQFNPVPPTVALDPNQQPGVPTAATFTINSTVNNFKFPQVFRTNIAIDKTLPGGLVATLEGIYTKDVNAIYIRDANLVNPTGTLAGDGRPLYPGGTANRVNPDRIVQALVLDNISQGYSWSVTAQLQKTFASGFYASAAYTYTDSRDINSQSGSTAGGLFTGNQIVGNPNSPTLSYSSNLTPHRVVASASYRKEYLKNFATTLSFIYTGSNFNGAGFGGSNFSYTYGSSPNNDGINNNDLIYIPRSQSEILLTTTDARDTRTVDQIWQQLDAYISQDKYLNSRRGQYAARNGGVAPWYNSLNARLLQDFFIEAGGKRNTLQLSVEVVNVLNLLNSNWGLAKQPARASLLQFAGYESSNGRPVYSFAPLTNSFVTTNNILSRWQLQVGLRYTFN